ncbi:MAG: ATP-binding protein [Candidatus Aminicenantes bacterium]|nr:ATP-binding protein [Candidatus Aminicenantes bacterium]
MVYKRFRFICVLRILILALSIMSFFLLFFKTELFAALSILGILIIYQIFSLIRYVDKTNRDLARLFESIKYADFSQTFKDEKLGHSFTELRNTFAEVTEAFRKTRAEKEEHYRYLQTVVQHVGIGLIAFQPNGDVELINMAAKKMLNIPYLKNIQSLKSFNVQLVDTLFQIKSREKALIKIDYNNELLHLALYATEFKLRGTDFILVSIQNIHSEIEETEILAWQKLIRVLTHEIMNSITPISSLASTINDLISESMPELRKDKVDYKETLEDIYSAIHTIQKRSQGLMHFVDAYRNLTLIPKPNLQMFLVKELLERIRNLMKTNVKQKNIIFKINTQPENLALTADPELVEQVLINLTLNALQAVDGIENPSIDLTAELDSQSRVVIKVVDNGVGIPEENLEKIFVPFFSTKEGGSGIGLSLSRQIMSLHQGSISLNSKPGSGSTFTLKF